MIFVLDTRDVIDEDPNTRYDQCQTHWVAHPTTPHTFWWHASQRTIRGPAEFHNRLETSRVSSVMCQFLNWWRHRTALVPRWNWQLVTKQRVTSLYRLEWFLLQVKDPDTDRPTHMYLHTRRHDNNKHDTLHIRKCMLCFVHIYSHVTC